MSYDEALDLQQNLDFQPDIAAIVDVIENLDDDPLDNFMLFRCGVELPNLPRDVREEFVKTFLRGRLSGLRNEATFNISPGGGPN